MTVRLLEKLPFSLIPLGNYLKNPQLFLSVHKPIEVCKHLKGETDRWPGRQASSIIKEARAFLTVRP
jgi:hypothetical protein